MEPTLEQFVNSVRTLTTYGNYSSLLEYVNKSGNSLVKYSERLDNVLETLNAQEHTIAYLAVLCAKFNNTSPGSTGQDKRFGLAETFINECNREHIRMVSDWFAEFCHSLTSYLVESAQALRGILLLKTAITKFRRYDTQLTSVHADFCQLCLVAKCFKPALEVLDTDITGICQEVIGNPVGSQFDAKYFLLYYYYGGMIYLAVRNLDRALYFFEVAITTPSHAVSHIMLEAYKKFIIVSLLLYGKIQTVPKYTSQVVNRFIKPLSTPYLELANAFVSNNSNELNNIIIKNEDTYTRDNNIGLVRQVSSVLYKKNIQRLTKTFLTLSLSDVAARVGLPGSNEAEHYILHMIEDEQIYATINQKDGMVIFRDEPDKYSGPDVLKNLELQLTTCMELDKQILAMDEEIQVNPLYVKKSTGTQDEDQPSKSRKN